MIRTTSRPTFLASREQEQCASQLGFQAEALQGGLNAWRSAYPVEPTSDTAA
jgi:hypothetical protein